MMDKLYEAMAADDQAQIAMLIAKLDQKLDKIRDKTLKGIYYNMKATFRNACGQERLLKQQYDQIQELTGKFFDLEKKWKYSYAQFMHIIEMGKHIFDPITGKQLDFSLPPRQTLGWAGQSANLMPPYRK